ncbi:MAG: YdcF family protein [Eubacteriales bacterium]|nr:YdcF family protein [Eubacteriales bacterium]
MLKKTFYVLLIILGVLGIAATMTAFFVSTGITIGTWLPGAAGIVIAAYGLIHLKRPGPVIRQRALRIIVTVIVCIGILSFVVIEALIIAGAGADIQQKEADYVIVLGCGIFPDGSLTRTLKNRLDTAYEYLTEYEEALCVVSGGQGPTEPVPEAEAMRDYLVALGIDEDRITIEPKSTSTKENLSFSANIMRQEYPDLKTAAVVTSDFHIFRAVMIAKNCGIDAFGLAAPTPWYTVINNYMREYVGVINTVLFQLD